MKLSLVVPCYNEEGNIELFYQEVKKYFKDKIFSYEIIFVNDGSQDHTSQKLLYLHHQHPEDTKIIQFSRNFGKEAAILAGLEKSNGDYVSIIDADLQQSPKYVVDMVNFLDEHEEYDSVAAYQKVRKENKVMVFLKDKFDKIINKMKEVEISHSASDFRTLRRNVVETIKGLPERCRFSKGIFAWVGYNTYLMPYVVDKRASGESKWSFTQLFTYAMDGIIAFSTKPLTISVILGVIMFCLSVFLFLYILISKFVFLSVIHSFVVIIGIILFVSGIQLFSVGILGQYLAKTYTEAKHRPIYIIKDYIDRED